MAAAAALPSALRPALGRIGAARLQWRVCRPLWQVPGRSSSASMALRRGPWLLAAGLAAPVLLPASPLPAPAPTACEEAAFDTTREIECLHFEESDSQREDWEVDVGAVSFGASKKARRQRLKLQLNLASPTARAGAALLDAGLVVGSLGAAGALAALVNPAAGLAFQACGAGLLAGYKACFKNSPGRKIMGVRQVKLMQKQRRWVLSPTGPLHFYLQALVFVLTCGLVVFQHNEYGQNWIDERLGVYTVDDAYYFK